MMSPNETLHGGCFCRRVRYTISTQHPPLLSAYCHCTVCQRLLSAPFIHTIHVRPEAFEWAIAPTPISEVAKTFDLPEVSKSRYRCKTCGAQMASWNSKKLKWSVWGATLDRDENGKVIGWEWAKPTDHQFYDTRMLDIHDNLDKWEKYAQSSARLTNS